MNYQNETGCVARDRAADPKKASPLAQEIQMLDKTVSETENLISQLVERLDPVLAKEPAKPNDENGKCPQLILSEHPGRVNQCHHKLAYQNSRIGNLIRLLEV